MTLKVNFEQHTPIIKYFTFHFADIFLPNNVFSFESELQFLAPLLSVELI